MVICIIIICVHYVIVQVLWEKIIAESLPYYECGVILIVILLCLFEVNSNEPLKIGELFQHKNIKYDSSKYI